MKKWVRQGNSNSSLFLSLSLAACIYHFITIGGGSRSSLRHRSMYSTDAMSGRRSRGSQRHACSQPHT